MAYTINRTDGTVVATITDGTLNNSTSLTLFGKSYSGFGEALNENLVKLLENSSSSSAPVAPLPGELWFDTASKSIKVYDGTGFKPTGGARAQGTQPTSSSAGDLWLDTDDNQVYAYTGSAWKLVGPVYSDSQQLSGWKVEDIGYSGGSHTVSSMYANNVRVAILSRNTFTPNNTSETSNGFAQINAGITLNSTLSAQLTGNTSSASALDVSSTSNTSANIIAGGNFLRADASDITTGSLQINNDSGVIVGPTPSSDSIEIYRSSGHAIIENKAQDKDLSIKIKDGSTVKTPIAITGTTGNIALTGDVTITGNLNITGEYNSSSSSVVTVDDAFVKVNTGNSEADAGIIAETGDTDDARLFYDVSENHWTAGENQSYSQIIRLADAVEDGDANKGKVLKTTAGGNVKVTSATLGAVGSISSTDTSNANVPTIGAVATFGNLWGGSAKTVSTAAPTSGDGNNGDFWFVREA